MNDPVGDLLIRLKNAALANRESLTLPHSRQKESLLKVLLAEGFVSGVQVEANNGKPQLVVALPKTGNRTLPIETKRISHLGCRVYSQSKALRQIRGLKTTIISTPKGIMTAKNALKAGLGGEVLCNISNSK